MTTRKSRIYRGSKCLNCETSLDISEKYCHQCGQLNSTKKISLFDFFEEFLANFYAYDSRLRNSIISIFSKPGQLATEYNSGKRQKYANPFRLFLSISIILFLSFNLTNDEFQSNNDDNKKIIEKKQDSIILETLKADTLEKKIQKKYSLDSIYTKKQLDTISRGYKYTIASFKNFHKKFPEKSDEKALKELGFENNFLYKSIYNKCKKFKSNDINAELLDYFYQKLPFFIFLSLPILTLMFLIVYSSSKLNYTEHLVFTYTYFTFMFLSMLLFNLIELISVNAAEFLVSISFSLLFPIYFYKSLRNFYQQSRRKTILKFVILNPLFIFFIGICAIIMTLLGILLF